MELKPRTYKTKKGYSVHIGGLMRVDIDEESVDSVYVTVWASSSVPLHVGKMENAYITLCLTKVE
ncbi:hypothetical protein YC2023_029187 [Brassica napus]|nr:unnamed protein product [Brassica napus]